LERQQCGDYPERGAARPDKWFQQEARKSHFVTILSFLFSRLFDMGFWIFFVTIVVGFLLNAIVIDWEDNQPGGFNNPK
jgi:hypothetical protein